MNLLRIYSSFEQLFKHPECIFCESLFVTNKLVCQRCWEYRLKPNCKLQKRKIFYDGREVDHYFLFLWNNTEDKMYSKLSRALKGLSSREAFFEFLTYALEPEVLFLINTVKKAPVIVPVAGRSLFSRHSIFMAESFKNLADIYSEKPLKIINIMKKMTSKAQKEANLKERAQIIMALKKPLMLEPFGSHEHFSNAIVIIDDVVTTEATVKATIKALPADRQFVVFSLLYRPWTHTYRTC